MQIFKKLGLLFLGLLVGFMLIQTTIPQSQSQTNSHKQGGQTNAKKHFEEFPIIDLNAPEPSDPDKKARHRARGKRYDNTDLDAESAKRFKFQEGTSAISLGLPSLHSSIEPAFPITQSDVIVIGAVKDAQAQISNDQTTVFSIFNVHVKDIFKDTTSTSLTPDCAITVERFGGRVRLPSGKVIVRGFLHQSMPLAGRRYIFFLKSNEEVQTYTLITGYELSNDQVIPLDGNRLLEGQKFHQLREYDRYEGANETAFLKEVKDAVANSLKNTSKGG